MSYNNVTKQFDPPPLLGVIYEMSEPLDQLAAFMDFVFYKAIVANTPLSRQEAMFRDATSLDMEILSGGWHSPFYQIFSWTQWSDIIEVMRFCGLPEVAAAIGEARTVFYRGRTDLLSIQARCEAGMDGFHLTREEEDRFHSIGDFVSSQAETSFGVLIRWPLAHRTDFIDFPR